MQVFLLDDGEFRMRFSRFLDECHPQLLRKMPSLKIWAKFYLIFQWKVHGFESIYFSVHCCFRKYCQPLTYFACWVAGKAWMTDVKHKLWKIVWGFLAVLWEHLKRRCLYTLYSSVTYVVFYLQIIQRKKTELKKSFVFLWWSNAYRIINIFYAVIGFSFLLFLHDRFRKILYCKEGFLWKSYTYSISYCKNTTVFVIFLTL